MIVATDVAVHIDLLYENGKCYFANYAIDKVSQKFNSECQAMACLAYDKVEWRDE